MKNYLYISFALMAFIFATSTNSYACSCFAPAPEPLKEQVKNAVDQAAAVFAGEVTEVIPASDDSYSLIVKFKVNRKWKAISEETVVVSTGNNSAMCGFNFEVGKTYLVYAHKIDSGLSTTICSRTAEFSKNVDVKYLKKQKNKKKRS